MALPKDKVFVLTEHGQQIRFVGQMLDGRATFGQLPRPLLPPRMPTAPRRYTEWIRPAVEPAEAVDAARTTPLLEGCLLPARSRRKRPCCLKQGQGVKWLACQRQKKPLLSVEAEPVWVRRHVAASR
jgi:hypothetical protein